jgi:hypothetical protein
MISHRASDRYYPAIWENFNKKLRILVVYSSWRGCFDTIQMFVNSLRKDNIELITIDCNKDKFIFLKNNVIKFDTIDSIANKFKCDIVFLLGRELRLSHPVSINSSITYSNYQISSISQCKDCLDQFSYTHFFYSSHSYTQKNLPKCIWLPTSIDVNLFKDYFSLKQYKYKFLMLWNKSSDNKNIDRLKLIEELKNCKINFHHFGTLLDNSKSLNSLEALDAINDANFNLDHNADTILDCNQFNDRFALSSILKTPVISHECCDLNMCFEDYLKYDAKISLTDNLENLQSLDRDYLTHVVESCYQRVLEDHDNMSRWAQVIDDHFTRINFKPF